MPNNPTKLVVDCSTGVTTEVELTTEEIEQAKADALEGAKFEAERETALETKAALKASAEAKLAALGLTSEEIAALG